MVPADEADGFYRKILDELYDGVYVVDLDRRITYWNRGAERISGYSAGEVVGTYCWNDVLVHVDQEGRKVCRSTGCPAADSMESGSARQAEVYLRHKDGHRVPIFTRIVPLFDDGEVAGALEVFSDNQAAIAARERIEQLERLALLDELTGLGNRRHAEIGLYERLEQLRRYGWPFGLLFIDIDRFKDVNDTFGHETGDRVLRMVALSARGALRSSDVVSRWGGEEFTAMVENVDEVTLERTAEKVRAMVERSSFSRDGRDVTVTVSIGGTMARLSDNADALVDRADRLMYMSKAAGRNRVNLG